VPATQKAAGRRQSERTDRLIGPTSKKGRARMTMPTHEIPTHLHGADPVVAGCTWSQLFILGGGAAGAFWSWHAVLLPPVAHAGLYTLPMLVAIACAFWHPDGHGLVTWLGLVAAYAVTPRRMVWQREAANRVLVPGPGLTVSAGRGRATGARAVESATRRPRDAARGPRAAELSLTGRHGTRHTAARRAYVTRAPAVVPARHRGGLLRVLLSKRLVCLSTHHLRVAGEEGRT
jgi:hypothetical protein